MTSVHLTQPATQSTFNPYGLHSIHVPLGLLTYRGVSPGAKLLYGRLALFRGRKPDGHCYPDLKTLAKELGRVHVNTVENWFKELVSKGFIERKRRQRQNAECIFLPHPSLLDSQNIVSQDRFDSQNSVDQERLDSQKTGFRFTKNRLFDSQKSTPDKEENIQRKHSTKTCASDDAHVGGAHAHQDQPAQPAELRPTALDGELNGHAASQLNRRPTGNGLTAQQKIWFDAWWPLYWLRIDRQRAWEAFQWKVRTQALFDRVMAATRAQTPEMLARDPGKRPYGATWLTGERWEDEPDQPAKLSPRKKSGFIEDVRQVIGERIARGDKPL